MTSNNSNNILSSHPLPKDKEEIISLWQTTFQDSDEFVNLFFSRVYKPENTLIIKSGDKIISALQMIPYKIKVADNIIPSAYVCGVCTLTTERGKGLMKMLMHEAIDNMRQKGYAITTLIPAHPWLFDIYKKFGYTHPINYNLESYSCEINSSNYTFTTYTDKYFSYFDRKQRERQCAVLHDTYDMENIIRDLKNDNGNAWIALHGNNPVGVAFGSPVSEKEVVIKEILYDNAQIKDALIHHILNTYNAENAKIRIHNTDLSENKKTHPYGLACILNKQITDIKDLCMTLMLD